MLPRSTGTSTYKPLPTDANLVDHDQDHDWLRNADDVDIERQAGLPTYPPPPAQPTGTNETTHPPGLTTWTYNPVWPMRGEKQRALGPIASSRQAAVELTRRAFPSLCNIPDQKITFEVSPDKDMEPFGPNIIILDDAWEAMATSPARPMLVSVRETHEETEKRTAHEWKEWYKGVATVFGCIAGVMTLFIGMIAWLSSD